MATGTTKSFRSFSSSSTGGKRLEEALEYVEKNWFPANSTVLRQVHLRFEQGAYEHDRSLLLDDLKSDPALLTHCLRNLKRKIGDEVMRSNPVELLRDATPELLRELLLIPETQVSAHNFHSMDKGQAQRTKFALVSSGTAETLAMKTRHDPDDIFVGTFLRQLGSTLVAWNYPRIYSRALQSQRGSKETLDEVLGKTLGFTPTHLGTKVIENWGLSPEFMRQFNVAGKASAERNAMVTLCEIGEAFAKLHDPQHYTSSPDDWKRITGAVNQVLGPRGMIVLKERLTEQFAHFMSLDPEVFNLDTTPETALRSANTSYSLDLFTKNTHAQKCSEQLRDKFRAIYAQIVQGNVSSDGLYSLVGTVIPLSGFQRGCVFLFDEPKMMLVPKLRIGDAPLTRYKAFHCGVTAMGTTPLVDAMYSNLPLKEHGVYMFGEIVTHVSGALGTGARAGVLYLEFNDANFPDGTDPITHFRAVRQCLSDCLNLK